MSKIPSSRTPQARKQRRINRAYLRAAIVATAADLPKDVRDAAHQAADRLESKVR